MGESRFQKKLIEEIKNRFSGIVVLKNDADYMPGVPDILLLYNNKWAMLECKRSFDAPIRPNQRYYVEMFNEMSFCSFICPENKDEILYELEQSFES